MRAMLSLSDIGRSRAGNEIFYGRVLPRVHTTSPQLRRFLLSGMTDVTAQSDEGEPLELTRFDFTSETVERVNKFLVRLTKGFIRHFHPDCDYSQADFHVVFVDDRRKLEEMRSLLNQLRYEERGDGVIRFGHVRTPTGAGGFFHYEFYRVTEFLVMYSDQHPRPWSTTIDPV